MSLASEASRLGVISDSEKFAAGIPVRRSDIDNRIVTAIGIQIRVISALIVRDMRSRFGGSHVSYLIAFLWPLVHALIVLSSYVIMKRPASFGTDTFIWCFSGVIPFVSFLYPMRFVSRSQTDQTQLMGFPIVKNSDVLYARATVEFMNAMAVFLSALTILYIYSPRLLFFDFFTSLSAVIQAALLGIAFGTFLAGLVRIIRQLMGPIMVLIQISCYLSVGMFFLPDSLPHPYSDILALNPVMHLCQKFRMGLFPGYYSEIYNPYYPTLFSIASLAIGLTIVRFTRK